MWKLKTQVCADSLSTDPNYRHILAFTFPQFFLTQRYLLSWRFILRVAHSSKWTEKWTVKCINVATEALSLSLVGMWYWTKFSSLIEEFQCKSNIEARGLQWLPELFYANALGLINFEFEKRESIYTLSACDSRTNNALNRYPTSAKRKKLTKKFKSIINTTFYD